LDKDEFVKVNIRGGTLYVKWSGDEKDTVIMQ